MQEHPIHLDPDHLAAVDVLLLMADSRAGSREYGRAVGLLDHAEAAAGGLPVEYELKRRAWLTR
jgi:hypothetical protein